MFKQSMVAMMLLATTGSAAFAAAKDVNQVDRDFVKMASQANMAEVGAAKATIKMSKDASVKQFASQMVSDHTKAENQLTMISRKLGLMTPMQPDMAHQKMMMSMEKMKEPAFTNDYIQAQKKDHVAAIALFEKEIQQGQNAQLKAFAKATLPTLKSHQAEVDKLTPQKM